MKILILGSTGMLGKALYKTFEKEKYYVRGISRSNADYNFDAIKDINHIKNVIRNDEYDVVINTIALINLAYCEENPDQAYLINTFFTGEIAKLCHKLNTYFIQISTDHYYTNSMSQLHTEKDQVILLNEYAKTKYFAETLTLQWPNSLVVRTNIVGFRGYKNLTFVEWIFNALENREHITGYTNVYTSSIDVYTFSTILLQLIENNEVGIINIAARGAISKYEFIKHLADKLDRTDLIYEGVLENQNLERGNSLGLSTSRLSESYPTIEIPSVNKVIENVYKEYLNKKSGE